MTLTLIFAVFLFGIAVMLVLPRTGQNGIVYVGLGWLAMLITVPFLGTAVPYSVELFLSAVPRTLFPALLLFGTLLLTGYGRRLQVVVLGITIGLARFFIASEVSPEMATAIATLFHVAAYATTVWVLLRPANSQKPDLLTYLLCAAYLALAAREAWGAVIGMTTGEGVSPFWWAAIGALAAGLQVVRVFQRFINRETRLSDQLANQHDNLRSLESRLTALIGNTSDLIIELDEQQRVLYVGENSKLLFGYDSDPAGWDLSHIIHPDDLALALTWPEQTPLNQSNLRPPIRVFAADGDIRWVEITTRRFMAGNEPHTAVVVRDITGRIASEMALEEANQRFRAIQENSRDVILEFDQQGEVTWVSEDSAAMLSYEPEELTGLTAKELLALFNATAYDSPGTSRNYIYSHQIPFSDQPLSSVQAITDRHGDRLWIEISASTFTRKDGSVGGLASLIDITDRVKLQEQYSRGRIIESLGMLAGGVAHDINNLLSVIQGNLEILIDEVAVAMDSASLARVEVAKSAIRKASDIANELLIYSGQGHFNLQTTDLSALVHHLEPRLHRATIQPEMIVTQLPGALPFVQADQDKLSQLVLALVDNAAEASDPKQGQIIISTGFARYQGKPHVYLEVKDNGEGMDEKTRIQAFDPFFTTRFTGRGLGLATVYGIVEAHNGQIEVNSAPGKGTIIRIYFPSGDMEDGMMPEDKALEAAATASGSPQPQAWAEGSARAANQKDESTLSGMEDSTPDSIILIADDESPIRLIVTEILTRAGYKVVSAATGETALDLARACADKLCLALLDLEMPDPGGRDLGDAILAVAPQTHVVLMSGHNLEPNAPELGSYQFLGKPFSSAELLQMIRNLLDTE
ncbi:MAG: PAS domain S-box protein [Pseudomonadales bacterium]|nr:PAS domain S-box protein [Pseudomonadales bacterium]